MSRYLTVVTVATRLRMSERFVKDELRRKNLRGVKVGGAWRIDPADLEAYENRHANVPRPTARAG